jgi:hypothetical protein
MNLRFANGNELPTDWHPGQPLTGRSVDLHGADDCPFGPACHSCRDGLLWNRAFETHLKPRAERY